MIDKPTMGLILQPLEKRFKSLNSEQREIYHDRLKWIEKRVLEAAVTALVDYAKAFPSPGEIKERCTQVKKDRPDLARYQARGCPHCHDGYVFYERAVHDRYAMYVGDCAYCHRGEISIQAQVVQLNDRVYKACEMIRDGNQDRFRANPDITELYEEATPVKTNQELSDYFHGR